MLISRKRASTTIAPPELSTPALTSTGRLPWSFVSSGKVIVDIVTVVQNLLEILDDAVPLPPRMQVFEAEIEQLLSRVPGQLLCATVGVENGAVARVEDEDGLEALFERDPM